MVVDNEELMECIRGDPVIYVRNMTDFKIAWKKKNRWTEISSAHKQGIILSELALWDK